MGVLHTPIARQYRSNVVAAWGYIDSLEQLSQHGGIAKLPERVYRRAEVAEWRGSSLCVYFATEANRLLPPPTNPVLRFPFILPWRRMVVQLRPSRPLAEYCSRSAFCEVSHSEVRKGCISGGMRVRHGFHLVRSPTWSFLCIRL